MTRSDINEEVLNIPSSNVLLELATGTGKSKLAIDLLKKSKAEKVLIVIPKLVLINNWKEEFTKWEYNNSNITFSTYVSFPRYCGNWDAIVFDEAHHLSQRCQDSLIRYNCKQNILLSATVSKSMLLTFRLLFTKLYVYKINTKKAIQEGILPDPKAILIPLELDNVKVTESIIINAKGTKIVECYYENRFQVINKYRQYPNVQIKINCTPFQYNEYLSNEIITLKSKYMFTKREFIKNKWLQLSNQRLKFLSNQKSEIIKGIIKKYSSKRIITFCNSINQAEELGQYCVTSKNKKQSSLFIEMFNSKKIKHITACAMLDEGINLSDCQLGIYANLNSSTRLIQQKLGRLLRHKNPMLIIPYYRNTRDEEIVNIMLEDYNKDLVETLELEKL